MFPLFTASRNAARCPSYSISVHPSVRHMSCKLCWSYTLIRRQSRPGMNRPLSRIFQKIRLAEPYFRLISGSAEFLRKLRNSAENMPEHHKFRQLDRQIETIKFKI